MIKPKPSPIPFVIRSGTVGQCTPYRVQIQTHIPHNCIQTPRLVTRCNTLGVLCRIPSLALLSHFTPCHHVKYRSSPASGWHTCRSLLSNPLAPSEHHSEVSFIPKLPRPHFPCSNPSASLLPPSYAAPKSFLHRAASFGAVSHSLFLYQKR